MFFQIRAKLSSFYQRLKLLTAIWRAWRQLDSLKNRRPDPIELGCEPLERASDLYLESAGDVSRAGLDLRAWMQKLPPKTLLEHLKDLLRSLLIAGAGAIVIRSCWFELYHVPTGSMRPAILEQDRLVVTKTAFGLNRPFSARPLLFRPESLERGQIVTFTSQGLDMQSRTRHFGLFPGHKRLVKRLWAKGGDRVYFYGGKIYILDKSNQTRVLPSSCSQLADLEIIPFVGFQGRLKLLPAQGGDSTLINTNFGLEIFSKGCDQLPWGMGHYGQVRLMSAEQIPKSAVENAEKSARYWLKICHSPTRLSDQSSPPEAPALAVQTSYLPLGEESLKALQGALYTARFAIRGQVARRVESPHSAGIPLKGVPDGVYEIFKGRGRSIGWSGNSRSLPQKHPLLEEQNLAALFNAGLDFAPERLAPLPGGDILPQRYAYFRRGALHLMGREIASSENPQLRSFLQGERQRARVNRDYRPFVDAGPPPMSDGGELLESWMRERGLLVPAERVLLLGDNHARSSDSRDFGFVPQSHIQGSPLEIFWPPSSVLRPLRRPPLPRWTLPRSLVWMTACGLTASHFLARWSSARRLTRLRPWRRSAG